MATTTTELDRDTAVIAVGDGVWQATISDQWAVPRGPNGGYIAALMLRAMLCAVDDEARAPRSLTLHYLRPPVPGTDATIHTTIERAGRTLSTVTARMVQDDRPMVIAIGAFANDFPTVADYSTPPPPEIATPPKELHTLEPAPGVPPIALRAALSPVFGPGPMSGGDEALVGGWLRLADPRPADALAVAFYTDAWLPSPFARLTTPAPAPTVDLTIHFRTRLPYAGMAPDDPVLARFSSSTSAGGFFEEDGAIWAPDGTLLAQSRQLALLFPGAAPPPASS
ncbi:acyl-CoA thioesterase [Baekduia sp. Peel2402]|uniref:acyl-CoA thioesterase n=1 Tax=Baekduia sp. Peel2402 TaxID=3458296 RepID=UPI00403E99AE